MVFRKGKHVLQTEIAIIGGGLGGCAAALAALEMGARVIMTEETDWIGGQLTSQGVPPDENRWIESHGCTRRYRSLRDGIREYYRRFFPLTASARASDQLNPGMGAVSRLCSEPRVGLAVLEAMLARYQASQQLQILLDHRPMSAAVEGDSVKSVRVRSLRSGNDVVIDASMFIDATELGELLPMAGVEHVMGAESRSEFGEPHAPEQASRRNQQAFTVCFAIDHVEGQDHTIDPPASYSFWRNYVPKLRPAWPGRL
ncbi:MAG: FAD-dependent oxidoreductase, partial [Verrucomicrobia bacterium]|nr:FAD-dependent oxidoreductase [Verrucomicrobiota bacterium]